MSITAETIAELKTLLGVKTFPLVWTEREIDELGIRSIHSLRRDRVVGGGIPFIKDKGKIGYPVLTVLNWMQDNLRTSTSDKH